MWLGPCHDVNPVTGEHVQTIDTSKDGPFGQMAQQMELHLTIEFNGHRGGQFEPDNEVSSLSTPRFVCVVGLTVIDPDTVDAVHLWCCQNRF